MSFDPAVPRKRGLGFYLCTVPAGVAVITFQGACTLIAGVAKQAFHETTCGFGQIGKLFRNTPRTIYYTLLPPMSVTGQIIGESFGKVPTGAKQSWLAAKTTAKGTYYTLLLPMKFAGNVVYESALQSSAGLREIGKTIIVAAEFIDFVWDGTGPTISNHYLQIANETSSGATQVANCAMNAYEILTMSGLIKRLLEEFVAVGDSGLGEVKKLGNTTADTFLNIVIPTGEMTVNVAEEVYKIAVLVTLNEAFKTVQATTRELHFIGDVGGDYLEREAREVYHLLAALCREGWKGSKQGAQLAWLLLKFPSPHLLGIIKETLMMMYSGGHEGVKLYRVIANEAIVAGDLVGDPVVIWWLESKHQFTEWVQTLRR